MSTSSDEALDVSRQNLPASVGSTSDVNSRREPFLAQPTGVVNLHGTQLDHDRTDSASADIDKETVRAYLSEMYLGVPGLLQIWSMPEKGSGAFFETTEEGIEQAVVFINAQWQVAGQQSIYARVTTMKGRPAAPGSRGYAIDSRNFICLWTDIDFGATGHAAKGILPPDAATAQMIYDASGLPEASLTVNSGGGLYHIVKLAEPLDVTDDETRMRISALSRRWQYKVRDTAETMGYAYGAGVSDLARVLRIPGTVNAKEWRKKRQATYTSSGLRYTLQELEAACPVPPKPARRAVELTGEPAKDARARLDHHLAEMRATTFERNNALNRLAYMSFQYAGAGQLDPDEVERVFTEAGLDSGLDESEVRGTVNSARTAGMAQPFIWKDFTRTRTRTPEAATPAPPAEDMWAGQLDDNGQVATAQTATTAPEPVITQSIPQEPEKEKGEEPETQTATAPPPPPADPPTATASADEPRALPVVDVTNERDGLRNLRTAIADGHLPEVYVRDGKLVHVTQVSGTYTQKGQHSTHRAQALDASYLRNMAGEHLVTTKVNAKGTTVVTLPTKQLSDAVLARSYWPTVPMLRDVVGAPFVRADGTVCQEEGYDTTTGMWLALPPGLRRVPENPSSEDVAEARRLILDTVLRDFPWVSPADRANYVALLFTPMLRELVDCLTPLGLITAAAPSSGKTLLTDLIACTHGGKMATLPKQDEELEKKINTFFMNEMVPTITFDNIGLGHTLNSPVLAQLLTQRVWDGRLLGRNESVYRVNDKLWMVTGNNLQINSDMRSRSVLVHIDPRVEKPEERDTTAFAVGNLDVWMRQPENKAKIVWSLLVMVRAWAANGMPKSTDEMRTYTPWAQTLGGLLAFHGIDGFRENKDELADTDEEKTEWSLFLEIWHSRHGDNWITAAQLLADYQNATFVPTGTPDPWQGTFPVDHKTGKPVSAKSIGKRFQYYKDRLSDGYVLRYQGVKGRAALWKVEHVGAPEIPEPRTETPTGQQIIPDLVMASPLQRADAIRNSVDTLLRTLDRPSVTIRRRTEEDRQ